MLISRLGPSRTHTHAHTHTRARQRAVLTCLGLEEEKQREFAVEELRAYIEAVPRTEEDFFELHKDKVFKLPKRCTDGKYRGSEGEGVEHNSQLLDKPEDIRNGKWDQPAVPMVGVHVYAHGVSLVAYTYLT